MKDGPKDDALSRKLEIVTEVMNRRAPALCALLTSMFPSHLSTEERDAVRGILADELSEFGLRPDDEPTRYGVELEDVSDWIGRNV